MAFLQCIAVCARAFSLVNTGSDPYADAQVLRRIETPCFANADLVPSDRFFEDKQNGFLFAD